MMRPSPPYFLIRISRQQEIEKKQKIGSILIPETVRFMSYNTQCGEIVAIGEKAHKHFPEAQIGHTLLCHHFVQGESENESREDHLVDQDGTYNYYVVSCYDFHRKGNETYAIWDGEKLIPNKEYIFLEIPEDKIPETPDEYIDAVISKTEGGLLIFKEWKASREDKTDRMKQLKEEIHSLSKSGTNKPHIITAIEQKEAELQTLSEELSKRTYKPHMIAAFNSELSEWFDNQIEVGDNIWMLNIACNTEIEFKSKKYIVAKTSYIGFINKVQE